MFLHAHPDDESSKGAGTMAYYATQGVRVSVVTFTDGGAGEILNPALADQTHLLEQLVAVRQREIAEALAHLAVSDHFDLGFKDSGWVDGFRGDGSLLAADCFYNATDAEVLERLVPIIRETRPQVLVTYDERGGYPHPDHLRTHTATMAAWRAAADPAVLPDCGPPWKAAKVYYQMSFTRQRLLQLQAACDERGIESPFREWFKDRLEDDSVPPERITTSIDVGGHLAARSLALKAHRTQVDPEGLWFAIPDDLVREVYPWEDFRLAFSEVATGRPEHDLFEGLT